MKSWIGDSRSSKSQGQIASLLGHPGGIGTGGAVGVKDPPAVDLHEDQYVQGAQHHAVDGEEVTGHNGTGLSGEKLSPGRTGAARRRRNPMPVEQATDGGGRDSVSHLQKFALDPTIAPPGVLATQAQDQLSQFIGDRWASAPWSKAECSPALANQCPVPAQKGSGGE